VLLPVGFLLGGVWHYSDDPGLGILLAPIGAMLHGIWEPVRLRTDLPFDSGQKLPGRSETDSPMIEAENAKQRNK